MRESRQCHLIGGSACALVLCATAIARVAAADPVAASSVEEASVLDLQQRMRGGQLSSRELTRIYLDRIAAIDKSGPAINAIIELNPDALAIAEGLDAERRNGAVRGPLHGIRS